MENNKKRLIYPIGYDPEFERWYGTCYEEYRAENKHYLSKVVLGKVTKDDVFDNWNRPLLATMSDDRIPEGATLQQASNYVVNQVRFINEFITIIDELIAAGNELVLEAIGGEYDSDQVLGWYLNGKKVVAEKNNYFNIVRNLIERGYNLKGVPEGTDDLVADAYAIEINEINDKIKVTQKELKRYRNSVKHLEKELQSLTDKKKYKENEHNKEEK